MFTGIVCMLLGIGAILAPLMSTIGLTIGVGAFLAASGIMQLVHAVKLRQHNGKWLRFGQSALAIIVGLMILVYPLGGIFGITLSLSFYFFVSSVINWIHASAMQSGEARGWGRLGAAISFILGVYILATLPISAFWLPGTLLGVDLLFGGLGLIGVAITVRESIGSSAGAGHAHA